MTLTGNWLQDKQLYPDWWRDVYICNAIIQEEEDKVRELFKTADELARQMQVQDTQRLKR